MKIAIEYHDETVMIDTSEHLDVHDMLDVFLRTMLMMGYTPESVDSAIVTKYHELNFKNNDNN